MLPQKRLTGWLTLAKGFVGLIMGITAIVIPVVKFLVTPTPFEAFVHREQISVPPPIAKLWTVPLEAGITSYQKHPANVSHFDRLQEVLVVRVVNQSPSVRHNVTLQINGILTFAGVGQSLLDTFNQTASVWQSPTFREDDTALSFPSISSLGGQTGFEIYVWGHYQTFLGPRLHLRSDEGPGSIVSEGLAGCGKTPETSYGQGVLSV
jgi:hypothetical protein